MEVDEGQRDTKNASASPTKHLGQNKKPGEAAEKAALADKEQRMAKLKSAKKILAALPLSS